MILFDGSCMNVILYSKNIDLLNSWRNILLSCHSNLIFCSDFKSLLECVEKKPSLVLFHLCVPYQQDIEYLHILSQAPPPERLFVLADQPDIDEGIDILHSGAKGYSNANLSSAKLKIAVEFILSGDIWVDKEILHKLLARNSKQLDKFEHMETQPDQQDLLSKREMQIVDKVLEGKTNAQAADELDISERTVKTHISNIFRKTNTKNRIDLMNKFQS